LPSGWPIQRATDLSGVAVFIFSQIAMAPGCRAARSDASPRSRRVGVSNASIGAREADLLNAAEAPSRLGGLLRVGLFVLIGWIGVGIFPLLMEPLAGLFTAAALSTFLTAALANAITVRIYERGRLADLGMGWSPTSGREFLVGAGTGAAAGA